MSYTVGEVIDRFVEGETTGKASYWQDKGIYRLRIKGYSGEGNLDTELIHYNTRIALQSKKYILINTEKYSKTTSKVQNWLKENAKRTSKTVIETTSSAILEDIHSGRYSMSDLVSIIRNTKEV